MDEILLWYARLAFAMSPSVLSPEPQLAIGFLALAPFLGTVIAGAFGAGASIYGAKKATSAAEKAGRQQSEAIDKQIAFDREQEARRQQEWERTEALNQSNWEREVAREQGNYDRNFNEDLLRDRRREPYRVAGRAALADLDQRRVGSMKDLMPTGRI